jgi:hypothetical protein
MKETNIKIINNSDKLNINVSGKWIFKSIFDLLD